MPPLWKIAHDVALRAGIGQRRGGVPPVPGRIQAPACRLERHHAVAAQALGIQAQPGSSAPRRGGGLLPPLRLPAPRLNYCPYCGHSLGFTGDKAASAPLPVEQPQQHLEQPGGEAPPTVNTNLLNTPLHFRPELHTRDLKEEPASLPVRIVCWLVIVALAALFVFIVYMGNKA